jgi:hypothetical protein
MSRTVFISHSSHDKAIGDQICRFLENKGVMCWIAPRDVMPGKNYGAAIVDAIDECRVFVLILSDSSNKSKQVVREVERAASSDSIIIPFRIDDIQPSRDLEFYVSSAHWLDASTKPLEKHLRELLKAIEDWQKRGAAPAERTLTDTRRRSSVSADPPEPTGRLRSHWKLPGVLIAIALLAGISAMTVFFIHRQPRLATSTPTETPSPAAELSPPPSASIALATTTPEITPVPTIAAVETPIPARLRPGEPLRTRSPSESPSSAGAAETSLLSQSPVRLRPGQSLATPSSSPPAIIANKTATPLPAPPLPPPNVTPNMPAIREVIASSEWRDENRTHRPAFAFDGNPATAWIPQRGADEPSITAHFKTPTAIATVSVLCGIPQEEFGTSNRIKQLRVTLSDGTNRVFSLPDETGMQGFRTDHPPPVDWIRLEILEVYHGSKTKTTPVAEIAFNREVPSAPPPASPERPKSGHQKRHSPPPKPG